MGKLPIWIKICCAIVKNVSFYFYLALLFSFLLTIQLKLRFCLLLLTWETKNCVYFSIHGSGEENSIALYLLPNPKSPI